MQRMHQRYKYMKAQQKKLVGVHPTCLLTKTQGIFRKPITRIYNPSSIMKDSHLYMKVTTQETLHHEDHGATLKHKCGKRIVALPLLSFLSFFCFFVWAFSFLWPLFSFFYLGFFGLFYLFIFVRSLIPTCGGIIVSIILSSLGQCSTNDDHHTFIYLQLKNYNSILRTRYDSI